MANILSSNDSKTEYKYKQCMHSAHLQANKHKHFTITQLGHDSHAQQQQDAYCVTDVLATLNYNYTREQTDSTD